MLKLGQVAKRYKGQQVLETVNLDVGEKEMISVMGRSGAGKSTLLGIMAGLIRADSGTVAFRDHDLTRLDEEGLAELRLRQIGIVFQDFRLIPSLSVFDNIYLGIHPRRDIAKQEKKERIVTLAGEVGLKDKLSEKVDVLSGGEKQRVAIARSLVNHPAIVLADEPTGNLDGRTAAAIMELFGALHQSLSTSFVIVTHDRDIARMTGKTYVIQEGVLCA